MLLHNLFHATVLVGLLGAHGDTAVSWHLKREHGEPETKWPPTRPYIVCLSSLLNTISAKHAGYLMQLQSTVQRIQRGVANLLVLSDISKFHCAFNASWQLYMSYVGSE